MKIKYCFIMCIYLLFGEIEVLSQQKTHDITKVQFSQSDISYIYNRVFDLLLRDKHSTYVLGSVFINQDYVLYDTILITVDPRLSKEPFRIEYIPMLKAFNFDSILNLQSQFSHVQIHYPEFVTWKHYEIIPNLTGNHFMHIQFSDIYYMEGFYYVGIKNTQQLFTDPPHFNDTRYTIYMFEWCDNAVILFRKVYFGLGSGIVCPRGTTQDIYWVYDINDRPCR